MPRKIARRNSAIHGNGVFALTSIPSGTRVVEYRGTRLTHAQADRKYDGTLVMGTCGETTRNDLIFAVVAGIHYNFRNSIAATLDYRFATVQTDFAYMVNGTVDDPGFSRHELLAGLRWAL